MCCGIKPRLGRTGNHIVVARGERAFDYHGHSDRARFLAHTWRRTRHFWPGWDAELIALPRAALLNEKLSGTFPGLWLREPGQFLHDPIPRAERFLDRFAPPERSNS